ncbi:O-antigen ligase family protein [Flagellimonas lutaonensis]|uniref:O-antigen ligase-related domain-containing protein n=1 Tax=Flagellimonas lutaonensis TaxID=516051 RepID=A0A0D5YSZ9_9FLAO|nr:O-antigen ligase family protein [Allomuricauda lutaonensis]AKA34988.1 hypothetical protein VC82_1360 [Allomuricauda lutaonensis]
MKTLFRILIAFYVLSIFFLEISLVPNRIFLVLVVLASFLAKRRANSWNIKYQGTIPLIFFIVPSIFLLFQQCASNFVLLNSIIPLFFIIYYLNIGESIELRRWIYDNLVYSVIVVFFVSLLGSAYAVVETAKSGVTPEGYYWWNEFTHKGLMSTLKVHPTYMAMFILSAICATIEKIRLKERGRAILLDSSVLFVLVLFLFLVSAKISYLALLFILLFAISQYFLSGRKTKALLLLLLIISIGMMAWNFFPSIGDRVKSDLRDFKEAEYQIKNKSKASERIFIWKACLEYLSNNPMGSFCSDEKELVSKYFEGNFQGEPKNAHNNFLEYSLMYGVIGGLILIAFVIYAFYLSFRFKQNMLFYEAMVFFVISLTESTLVRELGVIHFAVFLQMHLVQNSLKLNR